MVGKVWSDREEKYFWRTAVGNSPKRAGIDRAKPEKSWDTLAKEMQRAMGDNARREYTGTMLFEHYFQNIESQRKSPHAVVYVYEYLRKLGPHRQPPDMAKRAQYLSGASSSTPARRGRDRPLTIDNKPSTPVAAGSTVAPIETGPSGREKAQLPDFNAPLPAAPLGPNLLTQPGVFSSSVASTVVAQEEEQEEEEEEEEEEESLFVTPYSDEELEDGEIEGLEDLEDLEEGEIRE
ncbi:hypothetical protein F4809DRAFT_637374 [Biscogniauxia mediterranea]|nr:hypothetical protein F4809DRAFT_637374 [Biscogniauxia mediterranea]